MKDFEFVATRSSYDTSVNFSNSHSIISARSLKSLESASIYDLKMKLIESSVTEIKRIGGKMNNKLALFSALLSFAPLLALSAPSIMNAEPALKPATFNAMYAPSGFDSNDNVQFVGEGMFRNSCYRPAPASVKVDVAAMTITVGPAAYEYSGFCLQVILPFERVIDVGILKPGVYTVVQTPGASVLGTIKVVEAKTLNPDDFLYAPISQAFYRQRGLSSEVLLSGDFMTNCMSIDHVKVAIEEKAIVLQPIVKLEDRNDCLRGKFPFNKVVRIDLAPKGRYLLHVRSMNGKAVNTLVDVN